MMTDLVAIPQSREAEEALLGAVLINPDLFPELAEVLQPEDFYTHRLRFLWQACLFLAERRLPIDNLTLTDALQAQGRLEEVGGPAALAALLSATPTSLHAEGYAQIIREASIRRQLLQASSRIATLAYNQGEELSAVTEQALATLQAAVLRETGDSLTSLAEALAQATERIDALSRTTELPGTPSGIRALDVHLGNFQPGALYIIAARPGQGKTSLLLTCARHAARQNKKVAIFSLEMPTAKLTNRLLAQATGINVQLLDTGKISEADWGRLTQASQDMQDLPLFFDESPALTPAKLKTKLRRLLLSTGKLDLVIVDYLQLMQAGRKTENRTQEVGSISRALKALSIELDVPLLVAAQLNRDVERRASSQPQLSDLRESGDIEADADAVLFLHQPQPQPQNPHQPTEILIAKHRNGPTGAVSVLFHKSSTLFSGVGV